MLFRYNHLMETVKFIVPVYGIKPLKGEPIQLEKDVVLRSVNLLENEHEIFKKHSMRMGYEAVLDVDYTFDDGASEPIPGISIKLLNMIDAAFVVYGEGKAGLAAILPADDSSGYGGFILSNASPRYEEYLDKEIDTEFATYYANFKKAYDMRPMAFDIFRRSQERFSNNDRTIDSCTVLESILVPKGERSKKSFIVSGLKIMGYEKEKIECIEKLVDYRNAIIHADRERLLSLFTGATYTHSWFEDTFKFVREILFKYVEKPWD